MSKNKIMKIITIFILVFILMSVIYVNVSIGMKEPKDPLEDPGSWEITLSEDKRIASKAGEVLGIINVAGGIIAVIVLGIMGIKFMLGSIEEKADYKKALVPYVIGAVLLMAATTLPNLIYKITNSILG